MTYTFRFIVKIPDKNEWTTLFTESEDWIITIIWNLERRILIKGE